MENRQSRSRKRQTDLRSRVRQLPFKSKLCLSFWRALAPIICCLLWGCAGKVPEQVYADARKAFDAVDYAEAEKHFEEFVTEYPNHTYVPPAYYFLGESRARLGDSTGAIEAFLEAEKRAPERNLLRLNSQVYLAKLYRERGKWEASLDKLRSLVDSTSGSNQKNFAIELAQTLRDSGQVEEASAYLWERASTTTEPRFRGDYLLSLADLYWATETVEPMVAVLSEIIEDASIPEDLRVQAFYWRGQALEQSDRFDEAVQNFRELQEVFPDTIDAVEAKAALAALYQDRDPELSESYLREATEEFARRIADATEESRTRNVLRARLAEAYFRLGRYEKAIAAYEQIQLMNPEDNQFQQFVARRLQEIRDAYARQSTAAKERPEVEN